MLAHPLTGLFPDREQDTLSLVVAGTILVRLAEVTEGDRAIDRRDDLGQADIGRRSGQDVPAAHTALGLDQTGTFERQEDLFEVGLGQRGSFSDIAHRDRDGRIIAQRKRQQRSTGVISAGRHSHSTYTRCCAVHNVWCEPEQPSQNVQAPPGARWRPLI